MNVIETAKIIAVSTKRLLAAPSNPARTIIRPAAGRRSAR
jgi:hypothetical protein